MRSLIDIYVYKVVWLINLGGNYLNSISISQSSIFTSLSVRSAHVEAGGNDYRLGRVEHAAADRREHVPEAQGLVACPSHNVLATRTYGEV